MVAFVALFPLSILLLRKQRNPLVSIAGFMIFAAAGIYAIYLISNLLDIKGADNVMYYVIRELSFPFVSFFAQLNDGAHFGLFFDVLIAPLFALPSSITSGWFITSDQLNTELIAGAVKGDRGVTGTIPVDLVTFGLMQAHVVGVFLYATLFGYLVRIFSSVAMSFSNQGLASAFTAYFVVNFAVISIFYASPKMIFENHFASIIALALVTLIRLLRPRPYRRYYGA